MFSSKSTNNNSRYPYWNTIFQGLKEPKNVYDSLMPLHLITKSVGLNPYSLRIINDKQQYEISLLGSGYSITIMLLFVGYYTYAVETRDSDEDANKIARGIDMYQIYGSIIVMSFCILLSSYRQGILMKALKSLDEVDKSMIGYHAKINWSATRNSVFGYLIGVMSLLASCEYMNCTMFLRQIETLSTYCLLMCYIPMLINGFMEAQFVSYILLLKQRFSILNNELCCLISKKKYISSTKATKVDVIEVKKGPKLVVKQLSEILLDIGNIFIGFTTLAYYCFDGCMKLYLNDKDSNLYNTVTTGIWTLVKLSQLLILTLTCSLVKKEAKLAGEIIYKMDNRYEPELSSEVYSFGKQIIHWNFKFTAFNFFDIDMTLFYSAVASATTYLMILLQLDIANKQIEKSMESV